MAFTTQQRDWFFLEQQRKRRRTPHALVQRYFHDLDAAAQQYYLLDSPVTADRIVMSVYSAAGSNTGLPTGAPIPTAAKLVELDFAYSGTLSEIGKNGASYFTGIIADLVAYNGGLVVGRWSFNTNLSSPVVPDLVGGNNATAVNMTSADAWQATQAGADWLGDELVDSLLNPSWQQQGGGTVTALTSTSFNSTLGGAGLKKVAAVLDGQTYIINAAGLDNVELWFGLSGVSAQKILADGIYQITVATGNTDIYFRAQFAGVASFDSVSVKRLMETAL